MTPLTQANSRALIGNVVAEVTVTNNGRVELTFSDGSSVLFVDGDLGHGMSVTLHKVAKSRRRK